MPQFVTNTMRLCTRDAANASYDATVPVKPLYSYSGTMPSFDSSPELCSSSPYDVPWTLDDPSSAENPAAMFSVGNVPMWDGTPLSSNAMYPTNGYASQLYNTNPGVATMESWGESSQCKDGEQQQLACTRDSDCISLDPTKVRLQCYRGICVADMKQSPSCYSHGDCLATDQMCSGDGRCVDPILQVENHLDESIEFEMYAQNCSSVSQSRYPVREYDTYGASSWENIPDILRMYGMCSYHDWFEYLEFIDPTDDTRKNNGVCGVRSAENGCIPSSFNAFTSIWWDTLRPFSETAMPSLFDTRKFQVC